MYYCQYWESTKHNESHGAAIIRPAGHCLFVSPQVSLCDVRILPRFRERQDRSPQTIRLPQRSSRMKSVVHILTFTSNPKSRGPGLPGADFACSIHSYGYTIHPGVSWDGFGPGGNSIHAQSMHRTAESTKMSMTQHQTLRIQPGQIRRVFCWGEGTYFVTLVSISFRGMKRIPEVQGYFCPF